MKHPQTLEPKFQEIFLSVQVFSDNNTNRENPSKIWKIWSNIKNFQNAVPQRRVCAWQGPEPLRGLLVMQAKNMKGKYQKTWITTFFLALSVNTQVIFFLPNMSQNQYYLVNTVHAVTSANRFGKSIIITYIHGKYTRCKGVLISILATTVIQIIWRHTSTIFLTVTIFTPLTRFKYANCHI